MTFHKFYLGWQDSLSRKKSKTREGEHLMGYIRENLNEEFRRICSGRYNNPTIDCFFNDEYVQNTLDHLKNHWRKPKKKNNDSTTSK